MRPTAPRAWELCGRHVGDKWERSLEPCAHRAYWETSRNRRPRPTVGQKWQTSGRAWETSGKQAPRPYDGSKVKDKWDTSIKSDHVRHIRDKRRIIQPIAPRAHCNTVGSSWCLKSCTRLHRVLENSGPQAGSNKPHKTYRLPTSWVQQTPEDLVVANISPPSWVVTSRLPTYRPTLGPTRRVRVKGCQHTTPSSPTWDQQAPQDL